MDIHKENAMVRLACVALVCSALLPASPVHSDETDAKQHGRFVMSLTDGSSIIGVPSASSFRVKSSYADMDVPLKLIARIRFQDDKRTVSVELNNGDKVGGILVCEAVEFTTILGKLSIPIKHVKSLSTQESESRRIEQEEARRVAARMPKRQWGPEQATGAPDTHRAGDIPTAWATLQQNAGLEWLQVGFERAVNIAEVRIRETFNPGAVSKVVALLENKKEHLLWQGQDPTSEAPADFVVKSKGNVVAKSIRIYLDTTRKPG